MKAIREKEEICLNTDLYPTSECNMINGKTFRRRWECG